MIALPSTLPEVPELIRIAQRCVWFKPAEVALRDPPHLVAQVLTFGTQDDVRTLRRHLSDDQLREALERAPPGVFDPRSWAYWSLMLDRTDLPLPRRNYGSDARTP